MKTCGVCHVEKPISDFYPKKMRKRVGLSSKCIPCDKSSATDWYRKNKERSIDRNAKWQKDHPEAVAANQRKIRARKWARVFEVYGDKCACCGETEPMFLTVDHINNDGASHRREIKQSNFLLWLARNSYPPGFQILCMNCNLGKHRNKGACPHERVKNVAAVQ